MELGGSPDAIGCAGCPHGLVCWGGGPLGKPCSLFPQGRGAACGAGRWRGRPVRSTTPAPCVEVTPLPPRHRVPQQPPRTQQPSGRRCCRGCWGRGDEIPLLEQGHGVGGAQRCPLTTLCPPFLSVCASGSADVPHRRASRAP